MKIFKLENKKELKIPKLKNIDNCFLIIKKGSKVAFSSNPKIGKIPSFTTPILSDIKLTINNTFYNNFILVKGKLLYRYTCKVNWKNRKKGSCWSKYYYIDFSSKCVDIEIIKNTETFFKPFNRLKKKITYKSISDVYGEYYNNKRFVINEISGANNIKIKFEDDTILQTSKNILLKNSISCSQDKKYYCLRVNHEYWTGVLSYITDDSEYGWHVIPEHTTYMKDVYSNKNPMWLLNQYCSFIIKSEYISNFVAHSGFSYKSPSYLFPEKIELIEYDSITKEILKIDPINLNVTEMQKKNNISYCVCGLLYNVLRYNEINSKSYHSYMIVYKNAYNRRNQNILEYENDIIKGGFSTIEKYATHACIIVCIKDQKEFFKINMLLKNDDDFGTRFINKSDIEKYSNLIKFEYQ